LDSIPNVLPCALCLLGNGPVQQQLFLHGNGDANIHGGDIRLNSTATTLGGPGAAQKAANGQVFIDAGRSFTVAGNPPTASGTCTGCASGQPTYAPAIIDPLASLPQPPSCPAPGCPSGAAVAGPASGTASPGVYTTLGGGGLLTLNPGTYIITDNLNTGTGVTGTGVTLIFVCSGYPTPCAAGGEMGGMIVGNSGSVNISAPTSGQPYNGMAIMFDRNNCGPSCTAVAGGPYGIDTTTNNGTFNITGTIYAPMAGLNGGADGGYTINGAVIVRALELQSNGTLNLTYNPAQNYRAPSQGTGLIR
jgi:hypothetical protein